MQNRELSWLDFNLRVLEQGMDKSVPLLERLKFVSIFWSNLQEFFMVRVGSLTDLALVKKPVFDSKTGMTPQQQLDAIYQRCHELYPLHESAFESVRQKLAKKGLCHVLPSEYTTEDVAALKAHLSAFVEPLLSPQIVNRNHPFPHLENGRIYLAALLEGKSRKALKAKGGLSDRERAKNAKESDSPMLGLLPLPSSCERIIKLPGKGVRFTLLEQALELVLEDLFSMYRVSQPNAICVTRNADLDALDGIDESDDDHREHMKRILKKRQRLTPVRLESQHPLAPVMQRILMRRLKLQEQQLFATSAPLDMSYVFALQALLSPKKATSLLYEPFTPSWPAQLNRKRSVTDQVRERDLLLSFPYDSMDPFMQLLREAAEDPAVVSIKITLYRLARHSHLAEALIRAAEAGKEVTVLCELRARFDERNNIEWSQRFEEAGCNVLYGFRDYKVHSKVCLITRQNEDGLEYITQLGTGNYNESTAKLYTDFSFITADESFGRDAAEFFRNLNLESISDAYSVLCVAPLQIKARIMEGIDEQIRRAEQGLPCGLTFKTNSLTDKDLILKLAEASRAGVPTTVLARGISCLVPGVSGFTEHVRVVSIVGRLLEHSRIYCFGAREDARVMLSSADLMTRNMDKRIEVAWPVLREDARKQVLDYLDLCLADTAKLRELQTDGTYCKIDLAIGEEPLDAQAELMTQARRARTLAAERSVAAGGDVRCDGTQSAGDAVGGDVRGGGTQPAGDAVGGEERVALTKTKDAAAEEAARSGGGGEDNARIVEAKRAGGSAGAASGVAAAERATDSIGAAGAATDGTASPVDSIETAVNPEMPSNPEAAPSSPEPADQVVDEVAELQAKLAALQAELEARMADIETEMKARLEGVERGLALDGEPEVGSAATCDSTRATGDASANDPATAATKAESASAQTAAQEKATHIRDKDLSAQATLQTVDEALLGPAKEPDERGGLFTVGPMAQVLKASSGAPEPTKQKPDEDPKDKGRLSFFKKLFGRK